MLEKTGYQVLHVDGFDTDRLGTFTHETPRVRSQLETARLKARKGMELSGLKIGMASEGSFTKDPYSGMFDWNLEIVILIDDLRAFEIMGTYSGPAQSASATLGDWEQIIKFTEQAKFPTHFLTIKPDSPYHKESVKGVSGWEQLKDAFQWAMQQSTQGIVFIENDLRAFANPTRMQSIKKATEDLCKKLTSLCPSCQAPGFSVTQYQYGKICKDCLTPTKLPSLTIWKCTKCNFNKNEPLSGTFADPRFCDKCNP
jgi:hypothetical protein